MIFLKTGILSKIDKNDKVYLPMAIRKLLKVNKNEEIEYCINSTDEVLIKKYTKEN